MGALRFSMGLMSGVRGPTGLWGPCRAWGHQVSPTAYLVMEG